MAPMIWAAAALFLVIFRVVAAADSAFWCDEINWFMYAGKGLVAAYESIRREAGPMGPLDLPALSALARPLIKLGVHPHVALRGYTILLTVVCGVMPLISARIPRPLAWAWFAVTALSPAMNAMAVTARPPAGLLFSACCALFLVLEAPQRKEEGFSRAFKVYAALSLVAGLCHPYGAVAQAAPFLLVAWRSLRWRSLRAAGAAAVLFLPLLARPLWFFVIREPLAKAPLDPSLLWQTLRREDWQAVKDMFVRAYPGPAVSTKAALLFTAGGFFSLLRRPGRRSEALHMAAMALGLIVVPYGLSTLFHYPMSPRQWLGAYPILLWVALEGVAATMTLVSLWPRARWLRWALPLILLWPCVLRPAVHFWRNEPPTVDVPRYMVHRFMPGLAPGRKVILLSTCTEVVADLYESPAGFAAFFADFARSEAGEVRREATNLVWSRDWATCSGVVPARPDDGKLLQEALAKPGDYFVLSQRGAVVPEALAGIECRNETGDACHQVR